MHNFHVPFAAICSGYVLDPTAAAAAFFGNNNNSTVGDT